MRPPTHTAHQYITMRILRLVTVLLLPACYSALQPEPTPTTRRATLEGLVSVAAAFVVSPTAATAVDNSVSSPFIGKTYTDPINHPGGTRTIEFAGTSLGPYKLATVKGGGGKGEPTSYELPAMVFDCPGRGDNKTGQYCITIDFSPKGGPRDFQGFWDEDNKGIRFVLDNNFWPTE